MGICSVLRDDNEDEFFEDGGDYKILGVKWELKLVKLEEVKEDIFCKEEEMNVGMIWEFVI